MKAPKVTTKRTQANEWQRLQKKVFKYEGSKADERFFRQQIQDWLLKPQAEKPTWTQMLFNMVWKRNNDGRTLKYCYFNDHQQRVFLSRNFETWAETMKEKIKTILVQHYAWRKQKDNKAGGRPHQVG